MAVHAVALWTFQSRACSVVTVNPADVLYPQEDWLDLLPRFTKLEVFRGQGLWAAVTLNMQRMHGVIMQLVQLCPNLRQLDHSGHNQARQDWNRITIIREGPEGVNVRYRVSRCFISVD
jgi:hypothetical protein